MKKIFEKNNIYLSNECQEKFEKYYELLVYYNAKFNLTAITERNEVIVKHFVDSALCVDKLVGNKLIDVGSGGGFPALPIKILKNDLSVTLLEATGKKCEFLKTVAKELCLDNVFVENKRAEDLAKSVDFREKFDLCSARAVARLNTLCEYCLPFVKVGGKFVALKGDAQEELLEAKHAISVLGGQVDSVDNFDLDGAKRQIIYINKIKQTPSQYPRGNGKERKKPL